jgi:hypothetical protein
VPLPPALSEGGALAARARWNKRHYLQRTAYWSKGEKEKSEEG